MLHYDYMGNVNYKKIFAMKQKNEGIISGINPSATHESGIYAFTRVSEEGIKFFYVGQAKDLLGRLADHLSGYQHIDLSIKKWGFYSETNPFGYKIHVLETTTELDERERYWIKRYIDAGFQTRNKTLGGQNNGKVGLEDNKPAKGYYDGVAYGEKKTIRKVKEFFDKYLDFSIKGSSNKIKERKLEEFKELLDSGD